MLTFVHQVFLSISALTWFFIFCIVGNEVTTRYENVGDAFYDSSYELLTLGQAKYLPFIINNAQKSVKMRALMNIECTRETFKKVNINF